MTYSFSKQQADQCSSARLCCFVVSVRGFTKRKVKRTTPGIPEQTGSGAVMIVWLFLSSARIHLK
jgi:hypothetical protein